MADPGTAEDYAEHYRDDAERCVALVTVLSGDQTLAEEVVAEAFAKSWPHFRAGRVDDVHEYVRRAVMNTLNSRFRRLALERRHAARFETTHEPVDPAADPVTDRASLWPALLQLPIGQRSVLVLRFLEDQSEQQTAVILGIRVGTVKSRSARGAARLRELLGDADHV